VQQVFSIAHLLVAAYAQQLSLLQQPQAVSLVTLPAQLMPCKQAAGTAEKA
jgi:hypothetical protein